MRNRPKLELSRLRIALDQLINLSSSTATGAIQSIEYFSSFYTSTLINHQQSINQPTMKSFALFITAAIVASTAAINEPVASPTAAIEHELAAIEISAAIVESAATINDNEPVASPTAVIAIEHELAAYERQLGVDVTGTPTEIPGRPTATGVSLIPTFYSSCVESRGGCFISPLDALALMICGHHETSCAHVLCGVWRRHLSGVE